MHLKPSQSIAILNAPAGYLDMMGDIPDNCTISNALNSDHDVIQFFCRNLPELIKMFPKLKSALKDKGSLWISYPKKTSSIRTDIDRDIIWKKAEPFGLSPVAMIAIDENWSSFRLKKANQD